MRTSKSLRLLFVPCLAAAVVACWTAAPASGDTLCSVNESPCSSEHAVPVSTSLKSSGSAELGVYGIVCKSSVSYELKQNPVKGGEGTPIVVEPKSETFSECTDYLGSKCSVQATKLRSSVEWAAMSEGEAAEYGFGYVTSPPFSNAVNIEFTCGEISCKFEAANIGGLTSLEGGNPASEFWGAYFNYKGGNSPYCTAGNAVEGTRWFSSPAGGLYWTLG